MPEGLGKRNLAAAGNCYEYAWLMITNRPNPDPVNAVLCHGIATQTQAPFNKIGHAWTEEVHQVGPFPVRVVRDPQFPEAVLPAEYYYDVGGVDPATVVRYTPEEAMLEAVVHGTYGCWDPTIAAAVHTEYTEGKA